MVMGLDILQSSSYPVNQQSRSRIYQPAINLIFQQLMILVVSKYLFSLALDDFWYFRATNFEELIQKIPSSLVSYFFGRTVCWCVFSDFLFIIGISKLPVTLGQFFYPVRYLPSDFYIELFHLPLVALLLQFDELDKCSGNTVPLFFIC